ncbi:hypothetical protein ASZ78_013821 [Callipepla squamata]|uniref:Uncharacterized protein n=1 Tax=Callipepla squamata TaxID=9009 RepID=A0A226NBQ6_CALSU|nr:hypothetical protein ASZ78_013821 [Callipepla squamata]
MAAAGQEEDQDRDAVGGQKTFLSLSQINASSEQNVGVEKRETPFFYSISFRKLAEFLNFKQLEPSLKEDLLRSYYNLGFYWAKKMNFSLMQLSHFMDLLRFLLENLRDKHMTLEDNIKELGKAMAGIGETESERSGNVGVFSVDQANAITHFISTRYFSRICGFLFKIYNVVGNLMIK